LCDYFIAFGHTMVCFFVLFCFVTPDGFTTIVANEGLEEARAYLNQVLNQWLYTPIQRWQCKLQVKTPSEYTYSLFGRAE